ncbi:hypothetical protein N7533_002990 [Penicillium manginii]|uniref:uncharacterized protein n=1 Tax=Penicillium manginii TaxID=203109 RepID=UPI0025481FC2|nr:uncharacterized protein N7533_002990 [Penicillium manginii]KAJ5764309.1 hypothetical protein N7533_002990 [Penicillium manginii]
MASLLLILGLSRSDENPPRSRLTWHRRRRTETTAPPPYQAEADIVPDIPDPTVRDAGSEPTSETVEESPTTTQHDEDALADDEASEPSSHASTTQEAAGKSTASSLSRTRGSNPLKSIITRFRYSKSSKPNEQNESSEPAQPTHHPAESEGSEAPTRLPGAFSPLSRNPPSAGSEATEQQRTVSGQTAETQDSENTSATVHRHSSQLRTPVLELQQDCFSPAFFSDYGPEASHFAEGSDPIEEGMPQANARAPSKRSSKRSSTRSSNQSPKHISKRSSKQPSHEQNNESGSTSMQPTSQPPPKDQSVFSSRHTSNASYASRACLLDPVRAIRGFNLLSEQYNLQLKLVEEALAYFVGFDEFTPAANKADQDHVQNRNLGSRLIPGPLKLPACFVAMILYLRKYGHNTNGLFNEGDARGANRLYDYFASHVLDAEKEDSKIAITMRTIAMPYWEGESSSEQTLTEGLTFQALLTGLPDGLLGSVQLFEALQTIYDADIVAPIPATPRIQLITFAIIALTSEMQRALLCATFGLLVRLGQASDADRSVLPAGTPLRRVAGPQNLDYFARAFAPTLLGYRHLRDNPEEAGYLAIVRLLMENWQGVNRQLRDWAAGVKQQE